VSLGAFGQASVSQKAPSIRELFGQLSDPSSTNHAAEQILRLTRKDPAARAYIISNLPGIIDKLSTDQVWANAVRLAGQLKAAELIPNLIHIVPASPYLPGAYVGFGQIKSLDTDVVSRALCEIGDPAVQPVAKLLEDRQNAEIVRWRAARILWNMNTPSARRILAGDLAREREVGFQQFTEAPKPGETCRPRPS
jgi:HEAT repeat protein